MDFDIIYVALRHYQEKVLRDISNLEDRLAHVRNGSHVLYKKWDQQRQDKIAFLAVLDNQIVVVRNQMAEPVSRY